VQASNRQVAEEPCTGGGGRPNRARCGQRVTAEQLSSAVRDTNVDAITTVLEATEQEHEFLHHFLLFPVTAYICEALPGGRGRGHAAAAAARLRPAAGAARLPRVRGPAADGIRPCLPAFLRRGHARVHQD
jgi:hypothetical protein